MARRRDDEPDLPIDDMPVFVVDDLPFIDEGWLQERIYRDKARGSRWRQEAGRFYWRIDRVGKSIRAAYLTQAMMADLRVERWRKHLALTQAAVVHVQKDTRLGFGLLLRERRIAAGLSLKELSRVAGLDDKTIKNIETASFFISRKSIKALLAVTALGLTLDDVGPELLQVNPADGRKHKRPRQKTATKKRSGKRKKR